MLSLLGKTLFAYGSSELEAQSDFGEKVLSLYW